MRSHDEGDELTDAERREFVSRLRELKRNGSSLLVVGNAPDTAAVQACRWMVGDATSANRYRLFVSTDADLPSITDRLAVPPEELQLDTTTLVTWTASARSTAATPQRPMDAELPPVHVESDRLAELGITISEEIETLEVIAGEFAPSELRVCFDSLTALFADYETEKVFQFLHVLIGRVRSVRAMAHFHLPVDYDSDVVKRLAPLFDAVIELRTVDDRTQQRWHLQGEEITSPWLTPAATR